jgi:hypothetical protein
MLTFVECDLRLPIGITVTLPPCMQHATCLSRPRPSVSFDPNGLIICKHSLYNSQSPTEPCLLVVSRLQRVVTHGRSSYLPYLDMLPSVMAAHMLFSPCTRPCGRGGALIRPKTFVRFALFSGYLPFPSSPCAPESAFSTHSLQVLSLPLILGIDDCFSHSARKCMLTPSRATQKA